MQLNVGNTLNATQEYAVNISSLGRAAALRATIDGVPVRLEFASQNDSLDTSTFGGILYVGGWDSSVSLQVSNKISKFKFVDIHYVILLTLVTITVRVKLELINTFLMWIFF